MKRTKFPQKSKKFKRTKFPQKSKKFKRSKPIKEQLELIQIIKCYHKNMDLSKLKNLPIPVLKNYLPPCEESSRFYEELTDYVLNRIKH